MIVDTHVHVVARDEARFPLRPSGVGSQWFREHPVTVEEYLTTATDARCRPRGARAGARRVRQRQHVRARRAAACTRALGRRRDRRSRRSRSGRRRCASSPPCPDATACGCSASGASRADVVRRRRRRRAVGRRRRPRPARSSPRCSRPSCPACRRCWRVTRTCRSCSTTAASPTCDGGPSFPGVAPVLALAEHPGLHLKVTSHVLEAAGRSAAARVRRTARRRRSAPSASCGVPTTRRPTTAPTRSWSRWAATRARGSPQSDRARVLGGNALRLWPQLAH